MYCDPLYLPLSITANFTRYYINHFDFYEYKKLAYLIESIFKKIYSFSSIKSRFFINTFIIRKRFFVFHNFQMFY
ncbi:MAG: hypothetical protein OW721_02735 [Buchnera aphidicola (Macrosiphum albifrons)]|uniref:Uncharacterized protein n=1 Tax=Buchnera aphidicola (Macrosiphum albifrons) TaxID=2994844 RepID=A0AAJ5PT38_9GAMM|nr:MAG: hypothetical protein OW721_02735 [Buchnera aphidicola (Macrosiphum albifrons)]